MKTATTDFDARNMTIRELLFSWNMCFKIPEYQRPYTWTTDEAGDFWTDLTDYNWWIPYYFGSFILNDKWADNQIEIVDWQQRTLTISIFIMVIRDLFAEIWAADYANELQSKYVREHSLTSLNNPSNYIVEPWYSTKEYFRKIQDRVDILHEKTPVQKESKDICKVYWFFYEKIKKQLEKEDDDKKYLIKLLDKLLSSSCIRIIVKDETVAFTIFETVNARWAALSAWDLVKNLFFKYFHDDWKQDEAKELWDLLDSNTSQAWGDISTFLRNFWKAKHEYISTNELFKKIKNDIDKSSYEKDLKEIADCSNYYKAIWKAKTNLLTETDIFVRYNSPYEKEDLKTLDTIQNVLQWINFLWVKIFAPVFISYFANYKTLVENNMVPLELISNIEKFCYSFYAVCNWVWRDIETQLCSYAEKNWKICTKKSSNIKEELSENNREFNEFLKSKMPKIWEFSENFKEVTYSKRKVVQYSLNMISNKMELSEGFDDLLDYSKVSIEHILPQNPSEWGLTVEEVKDYVHSIWNLTLVWKWMNVHISNNPLKEKIEADKWLSSCKITITKALVDEIIRNNYVWNRETIEARTEKLCKELYKMNEIS